MVVLEVLRQRQRYACGHAPEHDGRARNSQRRIGLEPLEQVLGAEPNFQANLVHHLLAFAPGEHDERDSKSDQHREPAAVDELGAGRRKEGKIHRKQAAVDCVDDEAIVLPVQRDESCQKRGDRHQQRHRDAVGSAQRI